MTQPTIPVAVGPAWGGGLPTSVPAKRQPWGLVWAAAALVVILGVSIAGVATSWFGLAGSDADGVAADTTTTQADPAASRPSGDAATTSTYVVPATTSTAVQPSTTGAQPLPTTTQSPYEYDGPVITACVVGSDGATVNVRSGPSEYTTQVGSLGSNATGIQTTGRTAWDRYNEQWREVDYGGQEAWVHTYFLSPGQCTVGSPRYYCVNNYQPACSDLNVRIGPEGDNWGHIDDWLRNGYAVVGELAYNATGVRGTGVTAQDYEGDLWVQIQYGGGVGWVYGAYLVAEPCTPACG